MSTLYCSFCGKTKEEIRRLVAGPAVFICNECVALCFEINYRADQELIQHLKTQVNQPPTNEKETKPDGT